MSLLGGSQQQLGRLLLVHMGYSTEGRGVQAAGTHRNVLQP